MNNQVNSKMYTLLLKNGYASSAYFPFNATNRGRLKCFDPIIKLFPNTLYPLKIHIIALKIYTVAPKFLTSFQKLGPNKTRGWTEKKGNDTTLRTYCDRLISLFNYCKLDGAITPNSLILPVILFISDFSR